VSSVCEVSRKPRVLLIADQEPLGSYLSRVLAGYCLDVNVLDPQVCVDFVDAELSRNNYDMVLPTNNALTPASLQELVPQIKRRFPQTKMIVLSGYTPSEFVLDLKRHGIDDFLPLPLKAYDLLCRIQQLYPVPEEKTT